MYSNMEREVSWARVNGLLVMVEGGAGVESEPFVEVERGGYGEVAAGEASVRKETRTGGSQQEAAVTTWGVCELEGEVDRGVFLWGGLDNALQCSEVAENASLRHVSIVCQWKPEEPRCRTST